jgi:hypothetical protein
MAVAAVKSPNDQKKLLLAVGLGLAAILLLWWTFIGFGSSPKTPSRKLPVAVASPVPVKGPQQPLPDSGQGENGGLTPNELRDVSWPVTQPVVPEPGRNIFAFWVPPPPKPSPTLPPPSPIPTPPVLLASLSPSNVYARTDDFKLDVTGDLFSAEMRIFVDGREMPTRYVSAQQVSTTVPAAMIANPGQRSVEVRSNIDATRFSNAVKLNVTAPPTPNYTYVGIIGKTKRIGDIAMLQDKSSKEIISVQRGDPLGGRFRVTSISDRELVVVDTNLKIKHTLAMTNEGEKGVFPQGRPTPKVSSEDDEP